MSLERSQRVSRRRDALPRRDPHRARFGGTDEPLGVQRRELRAGRDERAGQAREEHGQEGLLPGRPQRAADRRGRGGRGLRPGCREAASGTLFTQSTNKDLNTWTSAINNMFVQMD